MNKTGMIIKVCGMREAENICAVDQLRVDWMGFIFYPGSSRFVKEVPSYLPRKAKRVGVFVNEEPSVIFERARQFGLDMIQLHGNESPSLCQALFDNNLEVIKAFSIEPGKPFPKEMVERYEGYCDYFLFDTQTVLHGGSGRKFDWQVLADYKGETSFVLSGGISPVDAEVIQAFKHPRWKGVDLNSRFESSLAIKDISLLKEFIKNIRQV